jgi:7-carboxy-7-deazaguanine synthase
MSESLRITEIFYSLQGESLTVGLPTVFVRLTGCPLRCTYCDTAYAFKGGKKWCLDDILKEVEGYGAKHVTVTGGEPLAQVGCHALLTALCDKGFEVSLETSGALDIAGVDKRVMIVLDLKTPASKEESKNLYQNLAFLKKTDQIKFVICDRTDYDWAVELISTRKLDTICPVLFSPSWGELPLSSLAEWILKDKLPVRFQIQLHKVIWPDDEMGR